MSTKYNANGTLIEIAGRSADVATAVKYDNTTSGMTATNVQGAIDELNASLTANSKNFYFDYQGGKYGCNTDPNRGAGTFIPFNQLGNLRKVTYSTNTGRKAQGTYDIHYTASQIGLTKVFGVVDDKTRSGNGQIYVTVDSDYSGVTIEYIVYSSGGDTMTTSFKYIGI